MDHADIPMDSHDGLLGRNGCQQHGLTALNGSLSDGLDWYRVHVADRCEMETEKEVV
jgi:hypothetical protein